MVNPTSLRYKFPVMDSTITRRKFLKAIGAYGGTALLFPSRAFPEQLTERGAKTVSRITGIGDVEDRMLLSSQRVKWKQIGMGASGTCDFLYVHPTRPELVFMCNDSGTSYYSINGGSKWTSLNDFDGYGDELSHIYSMEFCISQPNIGYLVNRFGIFRSEDFGLKWSRVNELSNMGVLTVDPADSSKLYCGSGNNRHYLRGVPVKQTGLLLKSNDAGITVVAAKGNMHPDAIINRIIIDPTSPSQCRRVFAATSKGFYFSNDDGMTWVTKARGLPHGHCVDLSLSVGEDGAPVLYLVLKTQVSVDEDRFIFSGGMYKSTDMGVTWISLNSALIFNMKESPAFIVEAYMRWIEKRFHKWVSAKSPVQALFKLPETAMQTFNLVRSHPNNPTIVYVGTLGYFRHSFDPQGIWKSADGGKAWKIVTRKGRAWSKDEAYWRNRNGQETNENITYSWIRDKKNITERPYNILDPRAFSMCETNPDVIYFATMHAVYKSSDGGGQWQQVDSEEVANNRWVGRGNSNIHGYKVYFKPGDPKTIYFIGADVCLWKSEDDGETLFAPCLDQVSGDCEALAFDPDNPATIYLAKSRGKDAGKILLSKDGGRHFSALSRPFDRPTNADKSRKRRFQCIHDLLIVKDVHGPKRVYACGSDAGASRAFEEPSGFGYGIAVSEDGGQSWKTLNKGLDKNLNVYDIEMDPSNPHTMYAAVLACKDDREKEIPGGLFKTTSAGANWHRVPLPSEISHVNAICLDPVNPSTLYIACGNIGRGKSRRERLQGQGVYKSTNQGLTWKPVFRSPCCLAVAVSPHDSNLVVLSNASPWSRRLTRNPGVFLSHDRAATWEKVNRGVAQIAVVTSFTFHPADPSVVWCGTRGGGWYQGKMRGV